MAQHRVELDEATLRAAQTALGTRTIKDTVNEALRRVVAAPRSPVAAAFAVLADLDRADVTEALHPAELS